MKNFDKIIFDAKVSDRKILEVPVNTLVPAGYNPAERTKMGKAFKRLVATVIKYGVIQPIVITAGREIVDGHRRLAAAVAAGIHYVDCIILPESVDKDEVFGDMNTTPMKMGGKGWLYAYQYGLRKLPDEEEARCRELKDLMGKDGIEELIENKIGTNILPFCKSIRSEGVSMKLAEVIRQVVRRKLVNKLNAIKRMDIPQSDKLQYINAALYGEERQRVGSVWDAIDPGWEEQPIQLVFQPAK